MQIETHKCAECEGDTRVIDSRSSVNGWIQRRKCLSCDTRYTTREIRAEDTPQYKEKELSDMKKAIALSAERLLGAIGYNCELDMDDL